MPISKRLLVCCAFSMACGSPPRDLGEEKMAPVISKGRPALQQCYQDALNEDARMRDVELEAALHIRPSGEVYELELSPGGPAPMRDCIEAAIRTWRFPAVPDPTHAALPLVFEPEAPTGVTGRVKSAPAGARPTAPEAPAEPTETPPAQ